jgi:hypothetical protein
MRAKRNDGGMDENAVIERYHNTYKDCYKVMRTFKSVPSPAAINQSFSYTTIFCVNTRLSP